MALSPVQQPAKKIPPLEGVVEAPFHDSLKLAGSSPSPRIALEEVPSLEPSPSALASPAPTAIPQGAESKAGMIAKFKEETESVLAQVKDATANFRKIDRLDAVLGLPEAVSDGVNGLARNARDFRLKVGYDIAFHETRAETETVDALVVVDQITRDIAAGDTPVARAKLSAFLNRYPQPVTVNQKPLWNYITSAVVLCNRLRDEAQAHLERARSLESAGKKSEALREYREIYRLYPDRVAAAKIRQLEGPPP